MSDHSEIRCGFVFAATGDQYNILARRAARSLRRIHADAAIDLYSDQEIIDPIFEKVHAVSKDTTRPKMEALRRSRFDRTIYLDCDIMVVADIQDLFRALDKYEFMAAHARGSNMALSRRPFTKHIPVSFPQVNTGVIAIRKSESTSDLMRKWDDEFSQSGDKLDQPYLRKLLYDNDYNLGILPPEYNLMMLETIQVWTSKTNAPRVLHCPALHYRDDPGDPKKPFEYDEILSPELTTHLKQLIASDFSLGGNPKAKVRKLNSLEETQKKKSIWRRAISLIGA
ncbi:putative nucleotide-diphospho-sugar transferase [Cognatishimia activa]|uniref:putative nucleotide-diphospho-sugar transferase n=1 Tax=Cognatishimia activa TaxID=1715691 RepID=UPI0013F4EDC3|nr:putative nucleotide-diphospho-sugar transferase [Cognatishimia activa]